MAAIVSPRIPISPRNQAPPEPSTIFAFVIRMSKRGA
jgi:hypothetical protein